MVHRSDFGSTWPDFVSDWCLGVPPSVSEDAVWSALDALERHWPEHLDDLLRKGAKGLLVILPAIQLGSILAACEALEGFDPVLRRIRAGEQSAKSEATFAAALVKVGYLPSLGPVLNGKELDTLVNAENQQVYAEVVAPGRSVAMRQAQDAMEVLAKALIESNPGISVEVLFQADISPEACQKILQFVTSAPAVAEIQEIPGIALVVKKQAEPGIVISPRIQCAAPGPVLGSGHGRQDGETGTVVALRLPMTDERVQRILSGEIHHFSKDQVNLLVIDSTDVPGGIEDWAPRVQSCFQPTRNRRVGAAILLAQAVGGANAAIRQRWHVLRNPYAYRQPPESLLKKIEMLDETEHWRR